MSADLRSRIAQRELLGGSFLNICSPFAAEMMALAGLDWVVIDLEHSPGGELEALTQIQAVAATSTSPIVRVEELSKARIGRALDVGAAGVLVPRIETAEEAAHAAACCRYDGLRGVAKYNRAHGWGLRGASLQELDGRVVCAVQIESLAALACVDEIVAVAGVDLVFLGPGDFSHDAGLSGSLDDPRLLDAAARIAQAAADAGKAAGVLVGTPEQVRPFAEMGFTFIGCSSDSGLLVNATRGIVSAFAAAREASRRHDDNIIRSEQ